jgi:hypothetical protein
VQELVDFMCILFVVWFDVASLAPTKADFEAVLGDAVCRRRYVVRL